jgi:hypothetical protein
MRKRYRVILIAAFVAALVVPVGYALSLESQSHAPTFARTAAPDKAMSSAVVAAPVMVRANPGPVADSAPATPSMSDAGKFLLLGTMLFGLSALLRKAI